MTSERLPPLLLCLPLALAGCGHDDALQRTDRISPGAGDANAANIVIQAADPLAGGGAAPEPGGDGARAIAVYRAYRDGGTAPPVPAPPPPASP